jgi:hypothetical protein
VEGGDPINSSGNDEAAKNVSAAILYLQQQQQQYRRWKLADRAIALYSLLQPEISPNLASLYSSGRLVIGEVGDLKLSAFTKQIDGEYVIQFNSGLIEFIYGISSILAGSVNLYLRGGQMIRKVHSHDETVQLIAKGRRTLV